MAQREISEDIQVGGEKYWTVTEKGNAVANLNGAVGHAAKAADVDYVGGLPIRPTTGVVNELANIIQDNDHKASFNRAVSEHEMAALVCGAGLAGARTLHHSSGVGVTVVSEVFWSIATYRLPVLFACGNRVLDQPGSFGPEMTEAMTFDTVPMIQLYPENPQEGYDMTLAAYRIGEDPKVQLPMSMVFEGHYVTHVREELEPVTDSEARDYVGDLREKAFSENGFQPLDPRNGTPVQKGTQVATGQIMEFKKKADEAMINAREEVIPQAFDELEEITGREYSQVMEYRMDDAEIAFVTIAGGMTAVAKELVDELREEEDLKIGVVRPLVYRPFPTERLADSLRGLDAIAVCDNNEPSGAAADGGKLFREVRATLYEEDQDVRPNVLGYILGLGGREFSHVHFNEIVDELKDAQEAGEIQGPDVRWKGYRE